MEKCIPLRTIKWEEGKVILVNQKKLPIKVEYINCFHANRIVKAIKNLEIRGAPAIGIAAAMGLALTANNSQALTKGEFYRDLEESARILRSTRPTARNLFWAIDRIMRKAHRITGSIEDIKEEIVIEAKLMAKEDVETNRKIGVYGSKLLQDGDTVGTICNAGRLATAGEYGTALGVIKVAHEQGKSISVIALETRPVLQGARLTSFELKEDGIDVRVITDGAIGYCFNRGMIDKFICGADRVIARDGCHVINKVGTHTVSIAANFYNIPFYVAAPLSTFDFEKKLDEVIIEERSEEEVTKINEVRIVPDGVKAINPAFDITHPKLISAIITERGVITPPFTEKLNLLL